MNLTTNSSHSIHSTHATDLIEAPVVADETSETVLNNLLQPHRPATAQQQQQQQQQQLQLQVHDRAHELPQQAPNHAGRTVRSAGITDAQLRAAAKVLDRQLRRTPLQSEAVTFKSTR